MQHGSVIIYDFVVDLKNGKLSYGTSRHFTLEEMCSGKTYKCRNHSLCVARSREQGGLFARRCEE